MRKKKLKKLLREQTELRILAVGRVVESENKRLALSREFTDYKVWATNEIASTKHGLKMANEEIHMLFAAGTSDKWTENRR